MLFSNWKRCGKTFWFLSNADQRRPLKRGVILTRTHQEKTLPSIYTEHRGTLEKLPEEAKKVSSDNLENAVGLQKISSLQKVF